MISIEDHATITKGIHCPYCNCENGVLINKVVSKTYSLQLPAYGLKWFLSVLYLSFIHCIIYGFKLWEINKKINTLTYVFCPECGNNYSMNPSVEVEKTSEEPPLRRNLSKKVISGLCAGISDYTGISLGWIRFVTVLYCLTFFGAIVYTIVAFCIPYSDNMPKKLYRNREKKTITGLCAGISNHTGISLLWIQIMTILFCLTIVGLVVYFVVALNTPFDDEVTNGTNN